MLSLLSAVFAMAAPAPPLGIVRPALHQYEDGPALPAGFRFSRGSFVHVSFRVRGYKASPEARIDVRCRIEAYDPRGVLLDPPAEKLIQAELAAEDKDWMPVVRHQFRIPVLAEPGRHRVVIVVEDRLAQTQAKTELPFEVSGPQVEASDALVERNFRFQRGEDSAQPVDPPVFHTGEVLWARFEITGYKIGEKNKISVEYGLSVLNASGKVLYSEPRAAVEDSAPFYPNRYMHGILSLNLEKAAKGEYTIVLSLKDNVGEQSAESKHNFRVE